MSSEVEETKTIKTLHDPSGLHPVQNLQTSVNCEVEETKALETLHDLSGLYPVYNPQTSVSFGVEETKPSRLYMIHQVDTQSGTLKLP